MEILFKIIPPVRLFGIKVLLPKALRKLVRPQVSMLLEGRDDGTVSQSGIISLENMLRFHWQIALGDQLVSPEAFLQYVKQFSGIVKLQDQYVYFDEKEIQSLIDKLENPLKAHVYHGPNRSLEPLEAADILITTYGVVRSEGTQLQKQKWLTVIIDEAQNIKKPATEQTKAVKKIKAPVRIAMSGTPVESRLSEYWSIFDFSNRGYLGNLKKFKEQYARPIEIDRDQEQLKHFRNGTFEEKINKLLQSKKDLADLTVSSGEKWIGDLSNEELRELVVLE